MPKSFEELMLAKLDSLLRIQVVSATKGLKQGEQIALLDRAGFQPKDIAESLGTTSNTVNVALSKMRKGKSKKGGRSGAKRK
jgi:DNA-directed RNA polymerase specialized sigma24 family protein